MYYAGGGLLHGFTFYLMKKWILRLAIAGIVVVALLELILWTAIPVGVERPLSLRLENDLPGFSASSRVNLDTDGVRSFGYQNADKRILFLGGDNTVALLESTPDTWWVRVSKKMSASNVGVAAWGVPSAGVVLDHRFLVGNIEALKPTMVVLSVSPNEVVNLRTVGDVSDELLNQPIKFTASGWKGKLIGVSQVARRLRNLFRGGDAGYLGSLNGKNKIADDLRQKHMVYQQAQFSADLIGNGSPSQIVSKVIRAMDALCKQNGAKLMVVGEPFPHEAVMINSEQSLFTLVQVVEGQDGEPVPVRIDPGALKHAFETFFVDISKTCNELGVPFVSTHETLSPAGALFTGDRLLNDLGHQSMADTLAKKIEANLP